LTRRDKLFILCEKSNTSNLKHDFKFLQTFPAWEEVNKMTKADIITHVAKKASLTNKAAREAVQALLDGIRDTLKRGDKVVLTGFGTFSVRNRAARKGRNPRTGAVINIVGRKTPGFTAGKAFKKAIR